LRGNARGAQKLSQKIDIYCGRKRSRVFDNDDWKKLKRTLDILPLGLTRIEMSLLTYLTKGPRRLTNLSAKMGMTKAALQRDMEMYLQKMELIEILPAGRALTGIGQEYLQDFKKWFK
jgi:Holliday junction resolvasome RuvABC ATP-dependent DNA helicase subunit